MVLGLFDPENGAASSERLVNACRRLASAEPARDVGVGLVEAVREELRRERIPVLHFRKEDGERGAASGKAGQLSQHLGTRKLALLRRRGGFRPLAAKRGRRRTQRGRWSHLDHQH